MSDLVERLRNKDWLWTVPGALREEAAVEIEKLRAALEEIVRNGDQGIHVPGPYDIAKAALTKEGK